MSQSTIDQTPSEAQLKYLTRLSYNGPAPTTKKQASQIIEGIVGKSSKPSFQQQPASNENFVPATPEELTIEQQLIEVADKYERLAISRITSRGAPLRGDVVHAERMYLVHIAAHLNACQCQ
tara:strand:- start:8681 stop:9046 length:366 start_codon:yes stop_codon:yes gene_type:complete